MMDKKVFIGKHLRKIMETRNMTQAELAQKTGIFQQLISRYCNDITVPTATSLILMAMTLDCSVDFLITGKEYKSAQPEPLKGQEESIPVSWLKEKLEGHPELPYAVTDGINNVLDLWEGR